MTADDLTAIAEPPGALLIELPQRDLGGQQPDWDDLRAQTGWARERGTLIASTAGGVHPAQRRDETSGRRA